MGPHKKHVVLESCIAVITVVGIIVTLTTATCCTPQFDVNPPDVKIDMHVTPPPMKVDVHVPPSDKPPHVDVHVQPRPRRFPRRDRGAEE